MPEFSVKYTGRPGRRGLIANAAADLFGLPAKEETHVVAEDVNLNVAPGEIVLFTGPSGSGKSSLLREVGKYYQALNANDLELPDVPLIDAFAGSLDERLQLLAAAGLSEGRVLFNTPSELSDGQRYRYRLARALSLNYQYIMLDEFAALLDRPLAKLVACNLRRRAAAQNVGVFVATANNDILADLDPHVHVICRGEGAVEVIHRSPVKKNFAASPASSTSPTVPARTGRISRGGIIAATGSAS
jgi:uncharacterized protein